MCMINLTDNEKLLFDIPQYYTLNEKMFKSYRIKYYSFLFLENIYMWSTKEWYVTFLKVLEFYDLYLVITKKLAEVMSCLAFFTQKFNIVRKYKDRAKCYRQGHCRQRHFGL